MSKKKNKAGTTKKEEHIDSEKLLKDPALKDQVQEKLDELRQKIDKFTKKVLDKFDKYIIGVALLPPEKKDDKKHIDLLLIVDDSDSQKMSKYELREKIQKIVVKIAQDVDKNIRPDAMLLTELRESCFDSKYEILNLISMSAVFYDPKDLLMALKVSEIHKSMVIKKFEKYVVSYVAVGSLFRGDARSHDIDVAIVIDDTDVKKMSRFELRDKLGAIIRSMGYEATAITGVKKSFHIQVYILTDFWDSIKEANPVIFTFLRDGVPFYDRGVFMPWKLLLQMGRIKPSPEAIDSFMETGYRMLDRAKGRLVSILLEDLYYAALNPSQAALMLYGVPPPTPRETIQLFTEIFVKKEKIFEAKYAKTLEKAFKLYKDVEHGTIKDVKGKQVDDLIIEIDEYLKKVDKLFNKIQVKMERKKIFEFYDECMKILKDVLKLEGIKKTNNIEKDYKKLVDKGIFPKDSVNKLKDIIKSKTQFSKLNKHEHDRIHREGQSFVRSLFSHIQRKRGAELERAKIKIKYGDKYGEVFLLDEMAFIVEDIDAPQRTISKAQILPDGGIGNLMKSDLPELEEHISSRKIPKKVFIKEKIFEDLRNIYGKDIEILVNY